MVTGATGLIGSALTARLISAGHNVSVVPNVRKAAGVAGRAVEGTCDIARMSDNLAYGSRYLDGVDVVVNCAGVLQDGPTIARAVSTSMALPLCSLRVSRRECGAWYIFPPSALIARLPQNSLAPSSKAIAG